MFWDEGTCVFSPWIVSAAQSTFRIWSCCTTSLHVCFLLQKRITCTVTQKQQRQKKREGKHLKSHCIGASRFNLLVCRKVYTINHIGRFVHSSCLTKEEGITLASSVPRSESSTSKSLCMWASPVGKEDQWKQSHKEDQWKQPHKEDQWTENDCNEINDDQCKQQHCCKEEEDWSKNDRSPHALSDASILCTCCVTDLFAVYRIRHFWCTEFHHF